MNMRPITVLEKKWVAAMTLVAMFTTSLPAIFALWIGRRSGLAWNGQVYLSSGDLGVYFSYIEQVKNGHWLLQNFYTAEKLLPVLNVFWLAVGLLARIFSLSPLAAYQAARLALIPALTAVSYRFICRLIDGAGARLAAFAIFFFGSGFGEISRIFLASARHEGLYIQWPTDLWVAESNTFLTMLYSPHFIASLLLLLLALHLFFEACEERSTRAAVGAGLAALVLFEFHPYHFATIYAVPLAWAVLSARRGRKIKDFFRYYGLLVGISWPAIAYHYYLTHHDAAARALLESAATLTPAPVYVAIGLGGCLVLAVCGHGLRKRDIGAASRWDFLEAWAMAQLAVSYSPLLFERRLLEGIEFPLVLLSVPALAVLWRQARKIQMPALAIWGACALFLPTTIGAVQTSYDVYAAGPSEFYSDPEQQALLERLRALTDENALILADEPESYAIGGWAGRRVYFGHWSNTIDAAAKRRTVADFFRKMPDDDRRRFLAENGITHLVASAGGEFDGKKFLTPIYRSGRHVVYLVADP